MGNESYTRVKYNDETIFRVRVLYIFWNSPPVYAHESYLTAVPEAWPALWHCYRQRKEVPEPRCESNQAGDTTTSHTTLLGHYVAHYYI